MPLDAAQEQRAMQWMQTKFPQGLRCPACGRGPMQLLPDLYADNVTNSSQTVLGGGVLVVRAMCNNCACVVSFAAHPMGITNPL